MNGEAVPDLTAQCEAKCAGQRLAAMNMEVVHHEMDRLSCRVLQRQFADDSRKLNYSMVNILRAARKADQPTPGK